MLQALLLLLPLHLTLSGLYDLMPWFAFAQFHSLPNSEGRGPASASVDLPPMDSESEVTTCDTTLRVCAPLGSEALPF